MNPKSGLEFSGAVGTTFSFRNKATDYQTAPEFHSEIAALKHLKNGLALGAAGYAYQQWGNDSGTGADSLQASLGAKSLKARAFGVGPIMTYSTKIGKSSLSVKAKYTHEFGARRRFESNALQASAALRF